MNYRFLKLAKLLKNSSQIGEARAKSINFIEAEKVLRSSGNEVSRDAILKEMESNPFFNPEAVGKILGINLPEELQKILNKEEKSFIELGAFLTDKLNQLNEIYDYFFAEKGIKQPGDLSRIYNLTRQDFDNHEKIKEIFEKINGEQIEWHRRAAAEQADTEGKEYLSNEEVHNFGDGWKVVYVPAAGEMEEFPGNPGSSHDRMLEGNKNGLCLGSAQGLYQNNNGGKIYSVRDPNNNPKVTIRINGNQLEEAKGKNNLPPDVEGAKRAAEWFELQGRLNYKNNRDYISFPPLSKEAAIQAFQKNKEKAYNDGWISHWYNQGIPEIDQDVIRRIQNNDISIIYSGLGKKYKELAEPVVKFWAEKYLTNGDLSIFGGDLSNLHQLSHESWKTYKKQPWMQEAVKKLSIENPNRFFELGLHTILEYKEIERVVAQKWAEGGDGAFFGYRLQETYPELVETIAKRWAETGDSAFFEYGLQKTYPELAETAAKSLAEKEDFNFFGYGLQRTYPKLGEPMAKSLAERGDSAFFRHRLHETYPKLAETAAKALAEKGDADFFKYGLQKTYRDLVETAAKAMAEKGDRDFFKYGLEKTFPEMGRPMAESLAEKGDPSFFGYKLHKTYPKLGEPMAKSLAEREDGVMFSYYRLHKTYPEVGRPIAERMAEFGSSEFFYLNLYETYPDLIEVYNKAIASKRASIRKRRFNKIARYLRISNLKN
jgi:hypothetical protein